ncbi:MAG TPA: sulfurtransferase TusA family protein [Methylomirabilota bacterium]|jgi:TusA-related sulfurtransferase
MGQHARPAGREVRPRPVPEAAEELDLRGEVCPYTFLKARLALESLPAGTVLRVVVDNETSARDVPRSLAGAGHAVLACAPTGDGAWAILTRRDPA